MRAALQETNALASSQQAVPTVINFDLGGPGTITVNSSIARMQPSFTTDVGDSGAFYLISAPWVTIDFGGNVGITSSGDQATSVVILVTGAHAVIQGFANLVASETSVAATSSATGLVIQNGTIDSASYGERALWLADGATDVTVRNVTIHRLAGGPAVTFASGASVTDVRLLGVTMDNANGSGTSNQYHGIGTATTALVTNLTVRACAFSGFPTGMIPLRFDGITLSGAVIEHNQFGVSTSGVPLIQLPTPGQGSASYIRDNMFDVTGGSVPSAIVAQQTLAGPTRNNMSIQRNSFQGFTSNAILLTSVGIMLVEKNTFGPGTYGDATPAAETGADSLYYNTNTNANGAIQTVYPTAVSYDPVAKTLDVTLAPPTGANLPGYPASIDVYYTPAGASDAQIYVGRATMTRATPTTISLPYTLAQGNIRVQTVGAAGSSSQYSRTVSLTNLSDVAGPAVTVQQAPSQPDPTSHRDIEFLVSYSEMSSSPLNASTYSLAGSTAPGAQITAVRQVTRTSYVVTVRANGAGTVQLSTPAGAVTDGANLASSPSTSTDNVVTYNPPYTAGPVTGFVSQTDCATFPVTFAPNPADPEFVPLAVATIAAGLQASFSVTASPSPALLDRDMTTLTITVCAAPGAAVSNGTMTASPSVASSDPELDGLQLGSLTITTRDMTPLWTLGLTSSPPSGAAVPVGAVVTFTLTATSTGGAGTTITMSADLSGALDDASWVAGSATLAVNGAAQPGTDALVPDAAGHLAFPQASLPAGGSVAATFQVSVSDPAGTDGDSVISVTGGYDQAGQAPQPCQAAQPDDTSCRQATLLIAAVSVEKTGPATSTDPGQRAPSGSPATVQPGTVTWAYTVRNIGSAPLTDLSLADDQGVPITCPVTTLDAGASMVCHGSGAVGAD